jgi:hypothetical protein
VTFALVRSLLLAEAATPGALGEALLLAATRRASVVRALLATGAIESLRLEQQLERGDAPSMRHVAPVPTLVQNLPPGLCERLLAIPVRRDPRTGTIDVAVVDARDGHAAHEIGFWLRAPVRLVRTSLTSMEAALRTLRPDEGMVSLAAPITMEGAPDLAVFSTMPEEPGMGPNIPFSLTRRSLMPVVVSELGPPAVERRSRAPRDPVLDLRRRKPDRAEEPPVAPTTRRGPFTSRPPVAPAGEPVGPFIEAMRSAESRDEILQLLVAATRGAAGGVTVFAVKRDAIAGWLCSPDRGGQPVRDVRIPLAASPLFGEALSNEGVLFARVPNDASHAPLAAILGPTGKGEVALTAVRMEGKPAALVIAGGLKDRSLAMQVLSKHALAAGDALARLVREHRK